MRTTIQQTGWNEVTIKHADTETGCPVTRVFWVPRTSRRTGYVREGARHSGDDRQVCEGLYGTGNTLESSPEGLLALIRKEWHSRRRTERQTLEALRWM